MINFFKPNIVSSISTKHININMHPKIFQLKTEKKSFSFSKRIVSQKLRYKAFVVVVYSWNGLMGLLVFFARSLSHTHSHSLYKSAHGFLSLSLTIHEIASHPSSPLSLCPFYFCRTAQIRCMNRSQSPCKQ